MEIINNVNSIIMTLTTIVIVVSGVYEVLSRVIPTSKTWSIIGNVIKVLNNISDLFDRKK